MTPITKHIPLIIFLVSISIIPTTTTTAQAQALSEGIISSTTTIQIPETTPCFLSNQTRVDLWTDCGLGPDGDFLQALATPFVWVTGGFIIPLIIATIMLGVWMKYDKIQYPMIIGIMFLPIIYTTFPQQFVVTAVILSGVALAIMLWVAFMRQTRD